MGPLAGDAHIVYAGSYTIDTPATGFEARIEGSGEIAVDVRGLGAQGWSEWTETPAALPFAVNTVEVRVVRGPGATVRAITMLPTQGPTKPTARGPGDGLTYEVFATREGLVGGRTASGHIIVERDHFAALPSRRGLSKVDTGDYSVKVCARNGRCEWAPVWDVGPWNTRDDYWNPGDVRQMWGDLPQGRPQAQAAKQDGYNGGQDQFGRTVRNPAGIDLADGTFWDGLGLTNNAWVTATFIWTGSGQVGTIAAGEPVNVRTGRYSDNAINGLAAKHAQVRIECQKVGEEVTGTQGTTELWYRIGAQNWISAAYVVGVTGAPTC